MYKICQKRKVEFFTIIILSLQNKCSENNNVGPCIKQICRNQCKLNGKTILIIPNGM